MKIWPNKKFNRQLLLFILFFLCAVAFLFRVMRLREDFGYIFTRDIPKIPKGYECLESGFPQRMCSTNIHTFVEPPENLYDVPWEYRVIPTTDFEMPLPTDFEAKLGYSANTIDVYSRKEGENENQFFGLFFNSVCGYEGGCDGPIRAPKSLRTMIDPERQYMLTLHEIENHYFFTLSYSGSSLRIQYFPATDEANIDLAWEALSHLKILVRPSEQKEKELETLINERDKRIVDLPAEWKHYSLHNLPFELQLPAHATASVETQMPSLKVSPSLRYVFAQERYYVQFPAGTGGLLGSGEGNISIHSEGIHPLAFKDFFDAYCDTEEKFSFLEENDGMLIGRLSQKCKKNYYDVLFIYYDGIIYWMNPANQKNPVFNTIVKGAKVTAKSARTSMGAFYKAAHLDFSYAKDIFGMPIASNENSFYLPAKTSLYPAISIAYISHQTITAENTLFERELFPIISRTSKFELCSKMNEVAGLILLGCRLVNTPTPYVEFFTAKKEENNEYELMQKHVLVYDHKHDGAFHFSVPVNELNPKYLLGTREYLEGTTASIRNEILLPPALKEFNSIILEISVSKNRSIEKVF